MKNANFEKNHVPWAQMTCLALFGPSLVFVWPALAFIGCCWPSFGLCWPVGVKMGGLDDVGVEMCRWGVETRGWELKHVVESRQVYYKENKSKKTQKIEKKKKPMAQTVPDASFGFIVVVITPQDLLVLLKHKFNLANNG
jgi:hypothetical protein